MNHFGQANTNSRASRAKRASLTGNAFLDLVTSEAEEAILAGRYDSGQRLMNFMADHFHEESETEGLLDYLANLCEEMAEHERRQLESAPVRLDRARAGLEALRDSRMPAPRFGSIERALYDNERRIRSERGRPIVSKASYEAELRNEIKEIKNE